MYLLEMIKATKLLNAASDLFNQGSARLRQCETLVCQYHAIPYSSLNTRTLLLILDQKVQCYPSGTCELG